MKRKGPAQPVYQPPVERGVPEIPPEAPPKRKRGRPRGSGTNKAAAGARMAQQARGQQAEQANVQIQHPAQGHQGMERAKPHEQYPQTHAPPPHDAQEVIIFDSLDKTLRYECKDKLGEGTYGVVYKGKVTVLSQQSSQRMGSKEWKGGFLPQQNNDDVAVKCFKAIKDAEGISTTIYREMCLLRELSHENIIKLRDVVLQPEKKMLCLVYEYGQSDLFKIEKFLKEPFKIPEIKSIMWQILSGIKYMHENWVIHRDIKPSNILVANGTIKIADFGLARIFRRPLKNLSDNGVVVTIWYRAFELLLMTKHYTPAIDIWAIGCIFGELFRRKAMFQGTEKSPSELQEDQLDKIIKVLGTPRGFTKPEVVEAMPRYHDVMKKWGNVPCILDEAYKDIDEVGRDLLKKLLCYDPLSRITAEEALKHPYFATNDFDKNKFTGTQDSRY